MNQLELIALQLSDTTFLGVILALLLAMGLLIPYLFKEIGEGKARLRAGTPDGAGDARPGRVGNPAPGQPDGQADPSDWRARR